MKKKVKPSEVKGRLQAPPSKSFAQRAIAIASLARGNSEIVYPGTSDDVLAAIDVAGKFGAEIEIAGDRLIIKGGISLPVKPLDCGEAGLSIRMFSSVAAVLDSPVILTGRGSLMKRPMTMVEDSLRAMGVECSTTGGYLPLTVQGPIRGGIAEVDGSLSSQVLTGMLIAAPYSREDLRIVVKNLRSRPYIDITLSVMESFGVQAENNDYREFTVRSGQKYRAGRYVVEGDWSGAAFLLVAGAIAGEVQAGNLNPVSVQADRAILGALKSCGAYVSVTENSASVAKRELKGFDFDATDCPDLFPPLVTLAANCSGISRIRGAGRLIHKESNRAATLTEEFGKLGVPVTVRDDVMEVEGKCCQGGRVQSHGDHRIAMACAVAALAGDGEVEIGGADAVAKSYPAFFDDLDKLIAGQI